MNRHCQTGAVGPARASNRLQRTHSIDYVADLPFDDLIDYPISRSIAVNGN
jgi:hypothetical protein